jgi:hypothetical protein
MSFLYWARSRWIGDRFPNFNIILFLEMVLWLILKAGLYYQSFCEYSIGILHNTTVGKFIYDSVQMSTEPT